MKNLVLFLLVVFGFFGMTLEAQNILGQLNGAGGSFGGATAFVGDINKDGFDDIIVGAYTANSSTGQAAVFSGRDGSLLYSHVGKAAKDQFGISVAGVGDTNKDGWPDYMVGARNSNSIGYANLYSGKDGTLLKTFTGTNIQGFFGTSVAGGDVNNDGYSDVIVGALGVTVGSKFFAGQIHVYSGKDYSKLYTFDGLESIESLGISVAGAGDINKDGYDDILAGTTREKVRIYSGKDGTILNTFLGISPTKNFGVSVAGAGDVNNDGYTDIIVSATDIGGSKNGKAYVYSGKDYSLLHTFAGAYTDSLYGWAIAGAGDVNKDGYCDVVVGAPDAPDSHHYGQATVYSGKDGSTLATINGVTTSGQVGFSVAGGGDFNNDTYSDFLVGAPGGNGKVTAYSFSTSIAWSGTPKLGQTVTLAFSCPPEANLPYAMASAMGPGAVPIDMRVVNLAPDAMLFMTVHNFFPTVFANYSGILSATGSGKAQINILNQASMIGLEIYSAFITINLAAPSAIGQVSQSTSFKITP